MQGAGEPLFCHRSQCISHHQLPVSICHARCRISRQYPRDGQPAYPVYMHGKKRLRRRHLVLCIADKLVRKIFIALIIIFLLISYRDTNALCFTHLFICSINILVLPEEKSKSRKRPVEMYVLQDHFPISDEVVFH